MVRSYNIGLEQLQRERQRLQDVDESTIRTRAGKIMDKLFKKRKSVPCCPHCNQGIFPEDVQKMSLVDKAFAAARRAKTSS